MAFFYVFHVLVLVVFLSVKPAWAQDNVISEIRFVGNEVTKSRILSQELVIKVGDPVDLQRVEQSRQAIMDMGLFKSVRAMVRPGETGQIVEFLLSEKYYVIPLPRLDRTADGEVIYGGQVRFDNLGGLNQQLKLKYKAQRQCCGNERKVSKRSLIYYYPRFMGSQYGFDMSLTSEASPQEEEDLFNSEPAVFERRFERLETGLWRWLDEKGPSAGWSVGTRFFWRRLVLDLTPAEADHRSVGFEWVLRQSRVHDHLYSRSGLEFGYTYEQGLVALGSDTSYSRNHVYYAHYFPLGPVSDHQNLNMQVRYGFSTGKIPVEDYAYSMGGSRDLRGYEKGSITGKSYFLLNLEYLRPLWGQGAARGVLFMDVGNAYPDNRMLDLRDMEKSAGFGFRYKFKSFVKFEIRADLGYAFGLSRRKFYIGTKDTF